MMECSIPQPDTVHSDALQVGKLVNDALQVANSAAIRADERSCNKALDPKAGQRLGHVQG